MSKVIRGKRVFTLLQRDSKEKKLYNIYMNKCPKQCWAFEAPKTIQGVMAVIFAS